MEWCVFHSGKSKQGRCPSTWIIKFYRHISKNCLPQVAHYYAETAEARPERGGGARNIQENNRRRQHCQTYTVLYLQGQPLWAKRSTRQPQWPERAQDFNIGFSHPATDACSDCTMYKIRIKDSNLTKWERSIWNSHHSFCIVAELVCSMTS